MPYSCLLMVGMERIGGFRTVRAPEGRRSLVSDMFAELWRAVGDVMGKHGPAVDAAQSYAPSDYSIHFFLQIAVILLVCRIVEIGRAVQQECRDRSRMPSSA
eukprot:TRINITY_DN84617_c0_g1_i1.p2 TRINITY_DN84617_c0_g1~~TRINITY_DN84617_c0_g1_i1.p2  ORF type:complete len:102 (-),score=14.88 TRINITY_DN84617_c0_g1_i1:10-315(-)